MDADEPEPAPPEPKPRVNRQRTAPRPRSTVDALPAPNIKEVESRSRPRESEDEIASRLKIAEEDASHHRYLAKLTHWVFAWLLAVVTLGCVLTVMWPHARPTTDATQLASTLLTAIVTGGASYFAGKAAGKAG